MDCFGDWYDLVDIDLVFVVVVVVGFVIDWVIWLLGVVDVCFGKVCVE